MKKLHLLVIKTFIGPFFLTFFICLFVILMQFLWKYIDDLVGKGLDFSVILMLLFYASATFVTLAIPLALLLSSLMTFGNMGEKYELAAIKASGISLQKIITPLIIIALALSVCSFLFSNYIMPIANLRMRCLLRDVRQQKPALNISEGVFYNEIENFVIRISNKNKDGKGIQDIIIYDHTDKQGVNKITVAKSGKMESSDDKRYLIFTLYDGYNYEETINSAKRNISRPLRMTKYKEQTMSFDLSSFSMEKTKEEFYKNNYQMMTTKQLLYVIDTLEANVVKTINYSNYYIINNFSHLKLIDSTQKHITQNQNFSIINDTCSKNTKFKILSEAINLSRNSNNFILFKLKNIGHQKRYIYKHYIEWHKKYAMALTCLIFFFIGAPLGAIIRKGGLGLPLIISVLFFILFHIIFITGEKLSRDGNIPSYIGLWMSTAVLLPIGILLTVKATSDSPIFDLDKWKRNFALRRLFKNKY